MVTEFQLAKITALYNKLYARCLERAATNPEALRRLKTTPTVAWNKRITAALGRCKCWHDGRRQVELSTKWAKHLPLSEWRDVILHELAHAAAPANVWHGQVWKNWAVRFGADPTRCATGTAVSIAHDKVRAGKEAVRRAKGPQIPSAWERVGPGEYELYGFAGSIHIFRDRAGTWILDSHWERTKYRTLAAAKAAVPTRTTEWARNHNPRNSGW